MKTYLKCLSECTIPFKLNCFYLRPYVVLSKVCKPLGKAYGKLMVSHTQKREAECKRMYANARLFLAYDGALECGRDQAWWFKKCEDSFSETVEYWMGEVPVRASYYMAMDDPMTYPHAYVKWVTYRSIYKAHGYFNKHKVWIVISLLQAAIIGVLA